jgi:hypothetical protein
LASHDRRRPGHHAADAGALDDEALEQNTEHLTLRRVTRVEQFDDDVKERLVAGRSVTGSNTPPRPFAGAEDARRSARRVGMGRPARRRAPASPPTWTATVPCAHVDESTTRFGEAASRAAGVLAVEPTHVQLEPITVAA